MSEKNNIENIVKKINKIIFDNNLEKIIEMTYSYKKLDNDKYYNLTLFDDFLWYKKIKNIDFLFLKENLEKKLNSIINEILILLEELKNIALDEKWKILYKSLLYIKKILKVVILWLEFELEKAWYKSSLTKKQKVDIVNQIEEIEEENFWLKIKNTLSEIKLIHDFLFSLFIETKFRINSQEQLFFLNYINKLNVFLDKKDIEAKKINKKRNNFTFWNKLISRDKYSKLFSFIITELYKMPQKVIITNASSIYDGENFLEIPNKDTHKELTYKRVLELIVHEIESHYINSFNNKILLWNFRWARNLEKEEGLAKIMEAFLAWDDEATAVFVPTYMAKILYSELYSGDDFYKFIDIYNKMHTLRRHPINEFLRQKRNYSMELQWGQHKDISYWRWMIKALEYINKWWDFFLLFMWKVWFEDLDKLDSLYEENKDRLLFPVFIWDIISLYLDYKEKAENFIFDIDFIVNYLENKYHFKWIERFELRKNIWNKKDKIKKLLNLIDDLEK